MTYLTTAVPSEYPTPNGAPCILTLTWREVWSNDETDCRDLTLTLTDAVTKEVVRSSQSGYPTIEADDLITMAAELGWLGPEARVTILTKQLADYRAESSKMRAEADVALRHVMDWLPHVATELPKVLNGTLAAESLSQLHLVARSLHTVLNATTIQRIRQSQEDRLLSQLVAADPTKAVPTLQLVK